MLRAKAITSGSLDLHGGSLWSTEKCRRGYDKVTGGLPSTGQRPSGGVETALQPFGVKCGKTKALFLQKCFKDRLLRHTFSSVKRNPTTG